MARPNGEGRGLWVSLLCAGCSHMLLHWVSCSLTLSLGCCPRPGARSQRLPLLATATVVVAGVCGTGPHRSAGIRCLLHRPSRRVGRRKQLAVASDEGCKVLRHPIPHATACSGKGALGGSLSRGPHRHIPCQVICRRKKKKRFGCCAVHAAPLGPIRRCARADRRRGSSG